MDVRRRVVRIALLSVAAVLSAPALAQQDVDPAAEENPALVTPRTRSTRSELDPPRSSHPAVAALSTAREGEGASFAGLRPGRSDQAQARGQLGAPVRWTDTLDAWIDTDACADFRLHSIGASYEGGVLDTLILKLGRLPPLAEVRAALGVGSADRVERQEDGSQLLVYPSVGVELVVLEETSVVEVRLRGPASSAQADLRPSSALWIRSARPLHDPQYQAQGMAVFACDLRAMGLERRVVEYRSHATAPNGAKIALRGGAPDSVDDGSGCYGHSVELRIDAEDWRPQTVGTSLPLGQVVLPSGLGAFVVRHASLAGADLRAGAFVREDLPPVGPSRAVGIESVTLRRTAGGLRVDIAVTGSGLKGEDLSILAGLIGPDRQYLRAAPGVHTAVTSPDRPLILAAKPPAPDDGATVRATLWFQRASLLETPPGAITLQVAANLTSAGVLGEWRFDDLLAEATPGGVEADQPLSPVQRLVADAALAFAGALRAGDPKAAAALAAGSLADALAAEPPLGTPGRDPEPDPAGLRLRSVDVLLDDATASVGLESSADPSGSSDFRLDLKLARRGSAWKVTAIQALEPDLPPASENAE